MPQIHSVLQSPHRIDADFAGESVAFFAEVAQVFGLPPSVGQIYGLLYASHNPLSFTDIFERLEISKGSASQGLQFLRAIGAVHGANEYGDGRREYFEPELSLRQLLGGILRQRIMPLASANEGRMARLRALASSPETPDDFCLERVAQLETWQRSLRTVLPVLTALLGTNKRKK